MFLLIKRGPFFLLLIAGDVRRHSERQGAEFRLGPRHHHVPPLAGRHGLRLLLRLLHPPSKGGQWGSISLSQSCIHFHNIAILNRVCVCVCVQVLRPGVLWFLRNLNDPDFNPVQEMIHLPIYRHLRRFILSVVSAASSRYVTPNLRKEMQPDFLTLMQNT